MGVYSRSTSKPGGPVPISAGGGMLPGGRCEQIRTVFEGGLQPKRSGELRSFTELRTKSKVLQARDLGDDPVFGRINGLRIEDFFDQDRWAAIRSKIEQWSKGLGIVIGTGAALLARQWDCLVYADMARWELHDAPRQNQISNLGIENQDERAGLKSKRAFFVDWRAADRLKKKVWQQMDLLLDTHDSANPKMISASHLQPG